MRRSNVLALAALGGLAATIYVIGAGPAADEVSSDAPVADASKSAPEVAVRPGPADDPDDPAEDTPRDDPARDEPVAAPSGDAALVGVVFDLARGSIHTAPFVGATVEVRDADSAFDERMLADTLRGLDFLSAARRRPSTVASSIEDAEPTHVAKTDAEGRFRVEGVKPNRWTSVRIVADGYLPHEISRVFPAVGEERNLGRIDLFHGGVVAGHVFDEHERPVDGADVLIGDEPAARTAADGSFEISGMRTGVVTLRARRDGEISSLAPTVVCFVRTNDRVEAVRLLLPVGIDATGIVIDGRRNPVAGARVVATFDGAADRTSPATLTVRTDDGGHFRLRGIPDDATLELEISHPGAPTVESADVDPHRPIVVTLERDPRLLVRVVQRGTENLLVPKQAVWRVGEAEFRADARELALMLEGGSTYGIPCPGSGLASVTVRAPRHIPGRTTDEVFLDGSRDVGPITIELTPLPEILGQVVAAGGTPVRGARVVHIDQAGSAVASAISRSDGRFRLAREGDGGHLTATADGYARASAPSLTDALLVLQPENQLIGTVVGFDGEPEPNFGLLVYGPKEPGPDPAFVTRCRTVGDGAYRARHLPLGLYRIFVTACAPLEPGTEIRVAGEVRLDFDLRRSHGTLRGEVFVDGLPADGTIVRLEQPDRNGQGLDVSTAPGGSYRFPILPAGDYRIAVRRDDRPLGKAMPVSIVGGAHVELPLVLHSARLTGTVAGVGTDRATVTVARFDGELEESILTDVQGRFEFQDLAPGHYRLSARAPGRVSPPVSLRMMTGVNGPVTLGLQAATHAILVPATEGPWRVERLGVSPLDGIPYVPRIRRRSNGEIVLEQLPVGPLVIVVHLVADIDRSDRHAWDRFLERNRTTNVMEELVAELTADGPNRFSFE